MRYASWTKHWVRAVAARRPVRRVICWRVATKRRRIALTFDDGPDAAYTPRVLDLLSDLDVRASFFVLGQAAARLPDLVRRIAASRHEIGVHGYDHAAGDLPGQMARTVGILAELGLGTSAIRPPGGRLTLGLLRWSVLRRKPVCLWSVDMEDSRRHEGKSHRKPSLETLVAGDIVLLHDDNPICVSELPGLVSAARARGLEPVTISDLLDG